MEFKNDQFEKEASKTLQTLQELKNRLNNNFSTKGAEELNRAIKSVDVSPINKGLEAVQLQFSALQIAGKRVIENITDAAMNAVHTITSKLTAVVNQIKVGGANRAQNIEQAKFMLSGLGIEWKDIVDDINYGVQDTAYGLDAAARVASQLVASNVTLGEDMKSSLRAVSGVAAMTNSTYEEIGHIFTSVAGQGKLMTMQLQQFSLRGLNVAADLAKAMNTTEAAIRDMVTKGQIDFMTFAKAMDELYGEHAKEANKTFSGALSNTKAALSRLGADIQTQKFESFRIILLDVTTQLKEFKKAIKPAEDAIIEMMEAVGNLVSNFVKSINIKAIVEKISPAIQKAANFVRDFADAWREIRVENTPVKTVAELVQKLKGDTEEAKEATEEVVDVFEKLAALKDEELNKHKDQAWDIWNFGTYGNGQDRVDALAEDYELTQAYVDKMIELGWDQVKMDEYIAEQRKKAEEAEQKEKRVNNLKDMVRNVLAIFDNLGIVVNNVYTSIKNIITAAFGGLGDAFENVGFLGAIVNLTAHLANFSNKIVITKERADKLRPVFKTVGDILVTIAKGLYNCAKFLVNFISAAAQNEVVIAIFTAIKNAITKLVDGIGKLYTKLKESGVWDKFIDILKTVGQWLGERIVDGINGLGGIISSIGETAVYIFGKIVDKLKEIIEHVKESGGWFEVIKDFFKNGVDVAGSWVSKISDKLKDLFGKDGDTEESIFKKAYDKASAFGRGLIEGLNSITWEDLKKAGGIVAGIATFLSILQLIGSISTMNFRIGGFFDRLGRFFNSLTSISRAYANRTTAAAVEALGRTLLMIALSIVAIAWTIAKVPGGQKTLDQAVYLVSSFVTLLAIYEIVVAAIKRRWAPAAINKVNVMINAKRLALVAILSSLALFTYSVITLVKNVTKGMNGENKEQYVESITVALGIVAAIIGMLIVMMYAISRMAKDMNSLFDAEAMNSMSKMVTAISKAITRLAIILIVMAAAFTLLPHDQVGYALLIMSGITALLILLTLVMFGASRKITKEEAESINSMIKIIDSIVSNVIKLSLILIALTVVVSLTKWTNLVWTLVMFGSVFAALAGMLLVINAIKVTDVHEFNTKVAAMTKIANAMTLLVVSFAAVALSLGKMNQMGVTTEEFGKILNKMLVMIGIVAAIGALAAIPALGAGFAAAGSLLAGFGVAMLGLAANTLALALAFKIVVDTLPKFVSAVLAFSEELEGKKAAVIQGIGDFIGVVAAGLLVGILEALRMVVDNVEVIAEAVLDVIISICNALGMLLKNKSGPLVDAVFNLVEGILVFLKEVIVRLFEDLANWLGHVTGLWNLDDYEYDPGQYKDTIAEQQVQYLSADVSEERKQAARRWLVMNGYDEEGHRTEEWTAETEVTVKESYDISTEFDKGDWYNSYYSGNKGVTNAKNSAEKLQEETSGLSGTFAKIKEEASGAKEMAQEATGMLNVSLSSLGTIGGNLSADTLNTDALSNISENLASEAEESSTTMEEYQQIVEQKTQAVSTAVTAMATAIEKQFDDLSIKAVDFGIAVTAGFCKGMSDIAAIVRVSKASTAVANEVIQRFSDILDVRSPSHVMEKIGKFTTLGFANGITETVTAATGAAQEVGEATILSMRETIKRASLEAVNGIDNPRITPVLDLSNVAEGIGVMNGMFDTSPAYDLAMATSGEARVATRTRMSAFYQNGSSYDDTNAIGAINSLNSEVSTLKDAINGMQVVMDSKALVGQIATPMDKALGRKAMAGRRKV